MPSIKNTQPFFSSYQSPRPCEKNDTNSNLLHSRTIEEVSLPCKPRLKTAILGAIALLGTTIGMYCARRYLGGSDPSLEEVLSIGTRNGLGTAHGRVSVRAIPTALPLDNQMILPGALFQLRREFFNDTAGGFIEQKNYARAQLVNESNRPNNV